jgi:TonB-linked SusC/RagA family outer membrane protein
MRIGILLFLFYGGCLLANTTYSQSTKVTIKGNNIQLEKLLNEIEKQTDYLFIYSKANIDVSRRISINVTDKSVEEILDQVLDESPIQYLVEGTHIVLSPKKLLGQLPGSQQSSIVITGVIVDERGEALIGANVIEKGVAGNGAITDMDGRFSLTVSPGAVLEVSYIGYLPQEIKIVSGTSNYRIAMIEDSRSLEEVVVVGYGVQKKKLVTGATVQVSGDDVLNQSRTEILGALQGQTPGVNITQSSGMPGEEFKVVIRGMGTINNAAPLYVIDGIPGGNITGLNPSDIESIDVLKDAASAAIYGARAANGVILVTTRQGAEGKIMLSYDGYLGFQNLVKKPQLANAQQYIELINESRANDGIAAFDWPNLIPVQYPLIQNGSWNGTNWFEEIENPNAPVQNHAFNVIGGNTTSKFTTGISYSNQEGVLGSPVPLKNERYNFRINSSHVAYKVDNLDVIKIGENLSFSFRESQGIGIGDYYSNDIHNVLTINPLLPIYNSKGDFYLHEDKLADNWTYDGSVGNPVAQMVVQRGKNLNKNYNLRTNAFLEIQPVKDLKFRSVFGFNFSAGIGRRYRPYARFSSNSEQLDDVYQSANTGHSWAWENTLSYTYVFNNTHTVDLLAGTSMEKSGMGQRMDATNRTSLFPGLWDYAWLSNTGPTSSSTVLNGTPLDEERLQSFFGRVNYNYKEKYMLTLIMRSDGSSTFARGHRWGYFPSVSAGWVLTSESFLESVQSWMDFFKLRGSWGQNGNNRVENFQYVETFSQNKYYYFGNDKSTRYTGAYKDVVANPDISWETSEQLNLGFDARFLNSRLGVTFDWYNKMTKDWLLRAPILASIGTGAPFINGGDIRNTGVELGLNWNERIKKDLRYSVNFNLAYNKNEVTRIANAEGIIHGAANALFNATDEMNRVEVGYPIGYFWGYKTAGIFQNEQQIANTEAKLNNTKPGDVIFVDLNGDNVISPADKTMLGDPTPDMTAGLSFNVGYKGFDLAVTTSGAFGHQIIKSYRRWADRPMENYTTDIYERWHGEGTSNKVPRLTWGPHPNRQYISDLYIENADYVKIQNITLGYDFKQLLSSMPLSQARLYVTAQNFFTIADYSGLDPEVGYGNESWASGVDLGFFPRPKTFIIGINLKF